jgi:phosphoribosylformylglycinamidine synthase
VPITGGNVSLYNETDGKSIYPTPIIGVVGVIEDASRALTRAFRGSDDAIVLLGDTHDELGGSEFLKTVHGIVKGEPPRLDLTKERALIELLVSAAGSGLLRSAHDCSDGGMAVTLAECAFDTNGIGCDVDLPEIASIEATLFSESASRVVVTTPRDGVDGLLERAQQHGVPARVIGRTGGARLRITVGGKPAIDCDVRDAEQRWSTALSGCFQRQAS